MTNNPFIRDSRESLYHFFKWCKQNTNHRTFELILLLATVVIAALSLKSSNKALRLAREANASNDSISKQSLGIAKQNADASSKLAINFEKSADATVALSKATTENVNLSRQSSQALINSWKESKKQFELTNNPFLQIEIVSSNQNSINGWPTDFKYKIRNLGKYPVRIIHGRETVTISNRPLDFIELINNPQYFRNLIITDESPTYTQPTYINEPERLKLFKDLDEGSTRMYFCGFYVYKNLLNGEELLYRFAIDIRKEATYFEFNDNCKWDIDYWFPKQPSK